MDNTRARSLSGVCRLSRPVLLISISGLLISISGCEGGLGTSGTPTEAVLWSGEEALPDVQITIHAPQDEGYLAIGFGVTDSEGRCQIVTMASQERFALPPGDYRCTLTAADDDLPIPVEFGDVLSTPLTFSWDETDELLELEIPPI